MDSTRYQLSILATDIEDSGTERIMVWRVNQDSTRSQLSIMATDIEDSGIECIMGLESKHGLYSLSAVCPGYGY